MTDRQTDSDDDRRGTPGSAGNEPLFASVRSFLALVGRLNQALAALEAKVGLRLTSALVSLGLLGLAVLYVWPRDRLLYLGKDYGELSERLFSGPSRVAHRILTPLIGYLVGLRGPRLMVLLIILNLLCLASAFYLTRKKGLNPASALAVASVLAFSPVTYTHLYWPGYTDITTYFLMFLMLCCPGRPFLYPGLFFLTLLNREAPLFLGPFFLLLPLVEARPSRKLLLQTAAGLLLATAAYLALKGYIEAHVPTKLNTGYYADQLFKDPFFMLRRIWPTFYDGVFSAFKLLWAIPLAGLYLAWREGAGAMALAITLPILGALAQGAVAWDTTRLLTLAFPAILLAMRQLRARLPESTVAGVVLLLVTLNFFIPQQMVALRVHSMPGLVARLLSALIGPPLAP